MTVYIPSNNETDPKKLIRSLHQLGSGRSNAVGVVTLAASATSTAVTDQNCAAGSTIILVPSTAHAAAEIGAGAIYVPLATVLNGSFVIQHASNSETDRTYAYSISG